MPNLRTLILNNNPQLRLYPTSHPASESLEIIYLENCNLDTNFLTDFPNLKEVHLNGNVIRLISDTAFINNQNLELIEMSRSNVGSIDRNAFTNLTRLRYLDLSENRLEQIPERLFISNEYFIELNISRNRIGIIDVIESNSLITLDVSYSEVKLIADRLLHYLPNLRILILSHNPLEVLPEKLKSNSLQILDLSFCRLLQLGDTTFTHLSTLNLLHINGNRLSEPPLRDTFPKSLQLIHLSDNPWVCDCQSKQLKLFFDYLKQTPEKIPENTQLVCHAPKNVSGLSWHLACRKSWYMIRTQISPHLDRVWLFLIVTFLTLTVLFCVVSTARRVLTQRIEREQEQMERMAEEARARLRQMRQRQRESALLNAPDPRDLISPPSYEEALNMLRPSTSDLRLKRISVMSIHELSESPNALSPHNSDCETS